MAITTISHPSNTRRATSPKATKAVNIRAGLALIAALGVLSQCLSNTVSFALEASNLQWEAASEGASSASLIPLESKIPFVLNRTSTMHDDPTETTESTEGSAGAADTSSKEEDHRNNNNRSNTTIIRRMREEHCEDLKKIHGFWDDRQCDLWIQFIETNATIDMTPYLARNIPLQEQWWRQSSNLTTRATLPPGTPPIQQLENNYNQKERGRLIYHLHLHKMGGTYFCEVFKRAHPNWNWLQKQQQQLDGILSEKENSAVFASVNAPNNSSDEKQQQHLRHAKTNEIYNTTTLTSLWDNCNVPDEHWKQNFIRKSQDPTRVDRYAAGFPGGIQQMKHLHAMHNRDSWYQSSPYLGDTRESMRETWQGIMSNAYSQHWAYVANEGAMEFEPIFGMEGPYFYSTILREPFSWIKSMFRYDQDYSQGRIQNLEDYLRNYIWGGPNFVMRRLCGYNCVKESEEVMEQNPELYFLRAKSMLQHYDLLLTLEDLGTELNDVLARAFPSLQFELEVQTPANRNPKNTKNAIFSPTELELMHQYTWMDKILYEYGKLLIAGRRAAT